MIRGDEIANFDKVDMSKVQVLFFTSFVIVGYTMAIFELFGNDTLLLHETVELPAFSETLNALLVVSHAGYLGFKAIDRSEERMTRFAKGERTMERISIGVVVDINRERGAGTILESGDPRGKRRRDCLRV